MGQMNCWRFGDLGESFSLGKCAEEMAATEDADCILL